MEPKHLESIGFAEPDIKLQIIREMAKAIKTLGAGSDLLAIVFSIGDTQSDEDSLEALEQWNAQAQKRPEQM